MEGEGEGRREGRKKRKLFLIKQAGSSNLPHLQEDDISVQFLDVSKLVILAHVLSLSFKKLS